MKIELPNPTKARLAFAEEIRAGRIRWYNFESPQAFHTVTGFRYTAALDELVAAGLATVPSCAEGASSVAELTDLAARWRSGPGSTSPEPGPDGWRVRHPGIGVLGYPDEQSARTAAGTAGTTYPPGVPEQGGTDG